MKFWLRRFFGTYLIFTRGIYGSLLVKIETTVFPLIMSHLNSVPLKKKYYVKKEHHSNFCTFEVGSIVNVPGQYLRKYGISSNFGAVRNEDPTGGSIHYHGLP